MNYPNYYPGGQSSLYQSPSYTPTQYQTYQSYQPQYQLQYPQTIQQPQANVQQVQPSPSVINGKVVPTVENIMANDVPMDGSVAFFPRQDMSEIYAKSWNADGTIKTIIYKPFIDNTNNPMQNEEKLKVGLSDDITAAFMQRFDDIADRIGKLEKFMTTQTSKQIGPKAKKEVAVNE